MGKRKVKTPNHIIAKMIEMYLYGNKTSGQISNHFNVSPTTVLKAVNLYFEKPKENLTLKSKV